MDNATIIGLLEEHPELRERIVQLLSTVANTDGSIELADEAEQRVIDEMRLIGREALQTWATRQERIVSERAKSQKPKLLKHKKKAQLA